MTREYRTVEGHVGTIDERDRAPRFSAACSCGWTHDTRHARRTAEIDLGQHYAEVRALRLGQPVPRRPS